MVGTILMQLCITVYRNYGAIGASIGMITSYPMCAYILRKMSWNWIMYITGTVAVAWSVVWLSFVTDAIEDHPCISDEEVHKIQFRRDPIHANLVFILKQLWLHSAV